MSISVDALSFSYGAKKVLHDIRLAPVAVGKLTVLIGPNASGKSTLFKCMAGIQQYQSGSILLNNNDLKKVSLKQWSQKVCFMPQSFTCNAALTVFEVVLLALKCQQGWRVSNRDIMSVANILDLLAINHLAHAYVSDLSGGQQQLVSIAQTLIRKAQVFLLDEPTSALDLRRQLEVMQIIREITIERNIAIIVALHDLNLAAKFADTLILMREGCVLSRGKPGEILPSTELSETYGVKIEARKTNSGGLAVSASLRGGRGISTRL